MAQIRFKGFQTGTPVTLSNVSSGASSGAVNIPAFQAPAAMTGLPRIRSGQAAGDTLTLDTTGLTGITGYAWREAGGAVLGTSATFDSTAHSGTWIECALTCDQGVLTSPAVQVYMQMAMASHNADDAALLTLVPHEDITHLAVADGAWTEGTTWSGGQVPGNGARVLIPHGRSITYDASERCRLDWVRIDGSLTWSLTRSTVILTEHLIITRGGTLTCGTAAARLPAQHRAEFIISGRHYRDNSYFATDMNLARDARLMGRGILSQGTRIMWGAAKTSWLRTADGNAPMATDTSATLSEAPAGWNVGDTIMIGGTEAGETSQSEERVIKAISDAVVSWSDPLVWDHDKHNSSVIRTDLQPGIANLTRNIKIVSETGDSLEAWRRGHTMDMHSMAVMDLWSVEHIGLGRTQKARTPLRSGVIDNGNFRSWNNAGDFTTGPLTAQSNLQSRYPVHSHHAGFTKSQTDTVSGCTVRGTPGWGIVHHNGHVNINDCAVTGFAGAGIVSESGNETGEWLNNITMNSTIRSGSTPKEEGSNYGVVDVHGDFFRAGYGFAMRSRALVANGNMAMDDSWGFVFYHRQANGSIAKASDLNHTDLDLSDLQGFLAAHVNQMKSEDYPIVHANDNEAAASYGGGMFVTKVGPQQNHGLNINIRKFRAWGQRRRGLMVEYIGQYALTDTDVVAQDGAGYCTGIEVGSNTWDVAVVRPRTEGCKEGIYFDAGMVSGQSDAARNDTDYPRYMLVAHTSENDVTAYIDNSNAENGNGSKLRVWSSEPAYAEPSTDVPFRIAAWNGSTGYQLGISASERTNTLTDTVSGGVSPLPKLTDNMGIPKDSPNSGNAGNICAKYAQQHGYWSVSSTPYIIFPMYWSDRLTGNWIKTFHGIELTGSLGGLTNNGAYTLKTTAMTVTGDTSVAVSENTHEVVDVVALVTDGDGDPLSLSESYFGADHGRITISGDEAIYTPQSGYTGPDKAQFAVEDGKGNAIRVDLNFTVS